MLRILKSSTPFKIFNPAIFFDCISMIYVRFIFWIWNKCFSEQPVKQKELSFIIFPQRNHKISQRMSLWREKFSSYCPKAFSTDSCLSWITPYTPLLRYCISPLKSFNIFHVLYQKRRAALPVARPLRWQSC